MSGFESNWAKTTDVVRNHYGPRKIKDFGGEKSTSGTTKELEVTFTYDSLPIFGTGEMESLIPAGAFIKRSELFVIEAFTGGTSYNIGLYTQAGVAIDADGIDAAVATAALTAGAVIKNDGALVGAAIGANAGQVVVAATGTYTAGKARLLIEYVEAEDDGSGRYVAGGTKA